MFTAIFFNGNHSTETPLHKCVLHLTLDWPSCGERLPGTFHCTVILAVSLPHSRPSYHHSSSWILSGRHSILDYNGFKDIYPNGDVIIQNHHQQGYTLPVIFGEHKFIDSSTCVNRLNSLCSNYNYIFIRLFT